MKDINKITRINIKEVWRFEDKELTPWLIDNIDVIGDAIGIQLTNATKEQSTGVFNVDIRAEDIDGNIVVIENQFGTSDHDHLGKIVTYLSAFEAKIGIWIVEIPRTEHVNAINWLNEGSNDCYFYLLKLEAIKIGDSMPAPLLTKIVGPSEDTRNLGKVKKDDAERFKLRYTFWEMLLGVAKSKGLTTFNSISATKDSWISGVSGVKGLTYVFWVNQYSTRIELRIDRGKGSEEENLKILNQLRDHSEEIETSFGSKLMWADLEGYRVCSIRKDYEQGGYKSEESIIKSVINELVESMANLEKATKPFIRQFK